MPPTTHLPPWHTFSIFISSTFLDMQAERDHLKNIVFPKVEEELNKKRIRLEIVDLRWGVNTNDIADEGEREKEVLKVVLDEIKRCRPFFIGLLGDRYGWVPPEERMKAVLEKEGLSIQNKDKSVTALEIEFGVLASEEQLDRSLFYFREPLDYTQMSANKAARYSDAHDPELPANEKVLRKKALADLKSTIKDYFKKQNQSEKIKSYLANWDPDKNKVIGLESWGEMVEKDILQECGRHASDTWDQVPQNWIEQEEALLDAFVESHTHVMKRELNGIIEEIPSFCGRETLLAELKTHLISKATGPWGMVLTGESGSGKSAVFAMVYKMMQAEDCLVLAHSAGLSPRSKNIIDLLQIWNKQLSDYLGIEVIKEENYLVEMKRLKGLQAESFSQINNTKFEIENSQDKFRELLIMVSKQKHIVILIDALDNFEITERAKYMTWFPVDFPENVNVLCTAITGSEQKLREYHKNFKTKNIDQFSKEDAKGMILSICNENHKTLSEEIIQTILQKERSDKLPAVSSPLWLSLSLKLLMVLNQDDFERIYIEERRKMMNGKIIEDALQNYIRTMTEAFPPLPGDLFLFLLDKGSCVFGKNFTYTVFDYISCSRNGLRESDLQELFNQNIDSSWDVLKFANLRRWFKGHLLEQGFNAQWNLNHSVLRKVLQKRIKDNKRIIIHEEISNLLLSLTYDDPIRISETFYHLFKADNLDNTIDYLTSGLNGDETRAFENFIYQEILEDKNRKELIFKLLDISKNEKFFSLFSLFTLHLNNNLNIGGKLQSVLEIYEGLRDRLDKLMENNPFQINELMAHIICIFDINLGSVYIKIGDLNKAQYYYEESLKISKKLYEFNSKNDDFKEGYLAANDKLGDLHSKFGDWEKAVNYFLEAFKLSRELTNTNPKDQSYQNNYLLILEKLGEIEKQIGNFDMSLKYFEEHLKLSREFSSNTDNELNKVNLTISYEKTGEIYDKLNNSERSLFMYEESLKLSKQLYESNPENEYFRNIFAVLHYKLYNIHTKLDNSDIALNYAENGYNLTKKLYENNPFNTDFKNALSVFCYAIGKFYYEMGDFKSGRDYFEEGLQLLEEIYLMDFRNIQIKYNLTIYYSKYGELCFKMGDSEKALANNMKGFKMCRELFENHPKNKNFERRYIEFYRIIGAIYSSLGNHEEALKFYKEEFRLSNSN